jgi:hypothetical protein
MQERGTAKHIKHIQSLCRMVDGYYCISETRHYKSKFYKAKDIDLIKHLEIMQKRSQQQGTEFFGLLGFTHTNENRTRTNISHFFDMFFDIDNQEFKQSKKKTEKLRIDTQAKLIAKLVGFLGSHGLLPFATLINSGSGVHCHFFFKKPIETSIINVQRFEKLYQIMVYLFWQNTKGIYRYGNIDMAQEGEKYLDADVGCMRLSKPTKIFTKTITIGKENDYKVEIEVLQDEAERYLSFAEFEKIVSEYWSDVSGIKYENTFFQKFGKEIMCFEAEDKNEVKQLVKSYKKLLKGEPIEPTDDPETPTQDDDKNKGIVNDNGTKIKIKDKKMYYSDVKSRRAVHEWRIIQTGFCLHPKYQFQRGDDTIFEVHAVNHRVVKDIQLSSADFDTTQKLQATFNQQLIDIAIESPIRQVLFSYFKTHCKQIERKEIEIHENCLVHYNFAYSIKNGLLDLENKHFENDGATHIIDADFESEMLRNKNFVKPLAKVKLKKVFVEFYTELRKTFLDENTCNLYVAFLLAAMRRSDFQKHFNDFPGAFFYGTSQTGKSSLEDIASKIYNTNIISDPTIYNIYRKQKDMQNFIMFIDDLQDINTQQATIEFLKNSSHYHTRERDRRGITTRTEFRNSVMITTNYPISEEALTTRFIKMHITEKMKSSFKQYNKFKNYVNENAFYIFLAMYEIMYSMDFESLITDIKVQSSILMGYLQNSRLAEMYSILFLVLLEAGIKIEPMKFVKAMESKEQNYSNDLTNFIEAIADFIHDDLQNDNNLMWQEKQVTDRYYYIPYTAFVQFLNFNKYENFATRKDISKRITNYDFCQKKQATHNRKTTTYMIVDLYNRHFSRIFPVDSEGRVMVGNDKQYMQDMQGANNADTQPTQPPN